MPEFSICPTVLDIWQGFEYASDITYAKGSEYASVITYAKGSEYASVITNTKGSEYVAPHRTILI